MIAIKFSINKVDYKTLYLLIMRTSRSYTCNRNRFDSLSVRRSQYDRLSQQQLSFSLQPRMVVLNTRLKRSNQ